jgi:hypothetical protein
MNQIKNPTLSIKLFLKANIDNKISKENIKDIIKLNIKYPK